ncbi:hypothetical protein CWO90_42985 [Bradyrhizobium sp. Leo121]|nr:hypothetical protein CWO90_42985 [Bradyrhizobium sp. Leo121]
MPVLGFQGTSEMNAVGTLCFEPAGAISKGSPTISRALASLEYEEDLRQMIPQPSCPSATVRGILA